MLPALHTSSFPQSEFRPNTSLGYHPMLDIGMVAVIFCSQELDLSLPQ